MAQLYYEGYELSLKRALAKAPYDFAPAYSWFMEHENAICQRPYGQHRPPEATIPWAAQRGIHKPGKYPFALSITSTGFGPYASDALYHLEDGTWTMRYSAHERSRGKVEGSPVYNTSLIRCMQEGLPVGVFIKESVRHQCLGLAFIESYDTLNRTFWLRGPINRQQPSGLLSPTTSAEVEAIRNRLRRTIDFDQLTSLTWPSMAVDAEGDSRTQRQSQELHLAPCIRAYQEERFQNDTGDAYGSQCAISGTATSHALSASRISSYLGPNSKRPLNGIMLRADIGNLYRESLVSIDPEHLAFHVAPIPELAAYREFNGQPIRLPHDRSKRPAPERLAVHYASFTRLIERRGR